MWDASLLWGYTAKRVSQWTLTFSPHNHVTKTCYTWQTIWIVFTRRAFWDHCQQIWTTFTCLTPVEPKNWPLTFSSITTKRYVVDRSNYTFLNRYNKRNQLVWFSTTSKQLLNLTPVQVILWPPGFACTGCDPVAIWNGDPWTHTNTMKLSNLLLLFSWVNFRSVRPIIIDTCRFHYQLRVHATRTDHQCSGIACLQNECQSLVQSICQLSSPLY